MFAKVPIEISKVVKDDQDMEILRTALQAELDAINLYEQMANLTYNKHLRCLLMDVAKEEKTHVGEFQALLLRLDKEQAEELIAGKAELEKLIN